MNEWEFVSILKPYICTTHIHTQAPPNLHSHIQMLTHLPILMLRTLCLGFGVVDNLVSPGSRAHLPGLSRMVASLKMSTSQSPKTVNMLPYLEKGILLID